MHSSRIFQISSQFQLPAALVLTTHSFLAFLSGLAESLRYRNSGHREAAEHNGLRCGIRQRLRQETE